MGRRTDGTAAAARAAPTATLETAAIAASLLLLAVSQTAATSQWRKTKKAPRLLFVEARQQGRKIVEAATTKTRRASSQLRRRCNPPQTHLPVPTPQRIPLPRRCRLHTLASLQSHRTPTSLTLLPPLLHHSSSSSSPPRRFLLRRTQGPRLCLRLAWATHQRTRARGTRRPRVRLLRTPTRLPPSAPGTCPPHRSRTTLQQPWLLLRQTATPRRAAAALAAVAAGA